MSYFKILTFISSVVVCSELPKLSIYQNGHNLSIPGPGVVGISPAKSLDLNFHSLLPQQVAAHFLCRKDSFLVHSTLVNEGQTSFAKLSKELAHCRTDVKRHTCVLSGGFPVTIIGDLCSSEVYIWSHSPLLHTSLCHTS